MAVLQRKDVAGNVIGYFAVVNYRSHDGQRKQVRKNSKGKTDAAQRRDAERIERDLLNRRDAHELPGQSAPSAAPSTLSVAEYLETWLGGRRGIRSSTLVRYRHALASVIKLVGQLPLKNLTPLQIEGVYDAVRASGRAEKTVLNVHRVLKKALSDAVKKDVLARNPAERVEAPKAPAAEIRVLSRDELESLYGAADETPIGPLIRFIAYTGLRMGEALALTWADVEDNRLSVRRSVNSFGHLDEPKSRRSRRTISLSEGTVALLREIRRQQVEDKLKAGPAYRDQGFVFANALGELRTQSGVNTTWRRIVARADVPRARIHDLRHAHASHLLAEGWDLATVAERLGHSRTSITLDFYSHSLKGRDAALAADVDRIFGAK